MRPFVILDRDGVINQDSTDYIKSPEEWMPIQGSIEAITLLSTNGFDVFIATNQAGIARGKLSLDDLEQIHQKLRETVSAAGGHIRDIKFCPHHPEDDCECRKPKPGMLLQLAQEHQLNLAGQPYVGDSLKDLRAAEAAECKPVLVLTGNGQQTLLLRPDHKTVFKDLLAFAKNTLST